MPVWRQEMRRLHHRRGQLAQAEETPHQEKEKGQKREKKGGQKDRQEQKEIKKESQEITALGRALGR
jgi:hypothetical protein